MEHRLNPVVQGVELVELLHLADLQELLLVDQLLTPLIRLNNLISDVGDKASVLWLLLLPLDALIDGGGAQDGK